jgi:undecaprenyl-diphosphatase
MPRPELEAALLGLLEGATELLPVSSSAHVAAVPWLLGWELASASPARRKELEVAVHAGAAAALAPELIRALPDARTLALSLAPPMIAGYLLEERIERLLSGPAAIAGGLLAGAAALAAADRAGERREWAGAPVSCPAAARGADSGRVGVADALALGLAQAAALAPGVSRTGATLAAARARGFAGADASALSFAVAGPVLAGATGLKAWRLARRDSTAGERRAALAGAATAFVATRLALRAVGVRRRGPLWPWAAERAVLASAILAVRYLRGP